VHPSIGTRISFKQAPRRALGYHLDGMYAPYCAGVFLMEAEGVGLPVVERLLATRVENRDVTLSQYYVSLVTFSLQALIFIWNINKYQYRHRK